MTALHALLALAAVFAALMILCEIALDSLSLLRTWARER